MIHIQIIQVGKTKDSYFKDAEKEYLKRLSAYAKMAVDTVPEAKGGDDRKRAMKQEGEAILAKIQKGATVIALVIDGKEYTSEDFAKYVEQAAMEGKLTFVIGGPYGLSEEVQARADKKLSLSKMTFTHQMVRTILLEQIYRAFTIVKGKKYHY